jgi:hypothetical protein
MPFLFKKGIFSYRMLVEGKKRETLCSTRPSKGETQNYEKQIRKWMGGCAHPWHAAYDIVRVAGG